MENQEIIQKPTVRGGEAFKKTQEEKLEVKKAKAEYKKLIQLHGKKA